MHQIEHCEKAGCFEREHIYPAQTITQCVEMQAVPLGLKCFCEELMNKSVEGSGSGAYLNVAGPTMSSRKVKRTALPKTDMLH